ncbi:TPA: type II toxin-antitoxin system PrlF family antitoxin [Enterobacter hormaechei subsp. xiangfangensis]
MQKHSTAEIALKAESRLTERSQTTIPASIRDALHLKPGEYLQYSLMPGGVVMLSRADEETEDDPAIEGFLSFLERDMRENPQNIRPLNANLLTRGLELTAGMDIDIDAEITDDD